MHRLLSSAALSLLVTTSIAQAQDFVRQKLSNQSLDWAGRTPAPNLSKEVAQEYLLSK